MKKLILLSALLISSITIAQIKCSGLLNTVKALKVNHTDYATDSSWLQKVTFHEYYDSQSRKKVFFAIAKMNGREYVFCDFPLSNQLSYVAKWNLSSGKAFHKYIFNYKCNCE
jgi:hypothetical protein